MDNCAALLARAAQCRRLVTNVTDKAAIEALEFLAKEFEDQAAEEASAALASNDDSPDGRYTIARVQGGWLISRGADRVAVRATIEAAREEAERMKTFDAPE